ncbi:hypothetical protein ACFVUS_28710 [Nocardia sp. NPDC058058]|uniref:hypothetical protein n=1 Tax=Nocardia sp. NPDC058058 TaxID=3346317 RepID=UPI0036DFA26B
MNETTPAVEAAASHRAGSAPEPPSQAVVALGGLALGLTLLIVAFAKMDRIPGWADNYGAVVVYLVFFLYMSVAGRLTWWGIDTLREQVKNLRGR